MSAKIRKSIVLAISALLVWNFQATKARGQEAEIPQEPAQENLPRFALPAAGSMQMPDAASVAAPAASKNSPAEAKTAVIEAKNAISTVTSGTTTPRSSIAILSPAESSIASIYRGKQTVAQEYRLANGLKILILENHEYPVLSSLVW
ncbi:MAG: hypothetical protein K2X27_02790, partial [Candidatus Obscuribacterales bacterium]|nr:hypothetical protein [Candidatus Obscuribacterales bacterium]